MSFEDLMKDYCKQQMSQHNKGVDQLDSGADDKADVESQKPLKQLQSSAETNVGRWTKEEHLKFVEGISLYGKNWKKVEEHIKTRNGAQIRSHAQKFFNRLEREYAKKQTKASTQQTSESNPDNLDDSEQHQKGKTSEEADRKLSACSTDTYEKHSDDEIKDEIQAKQCVKQTLAVSEQLAVIDKMIFEKQIKLQTLAQQINQIEQSPERDYLQLFHLQEETKKILAFYQILQHYKHIKQEEEMELYKQMHYQQTQLNHDEQELYQLLSYLQMLEQRTGLSSGWIQPPQPSQMPIKQSNIMNLPKPSSFGCDADTELKEVARKRKNSFVLYKDRHNEEVMKLESLHKRILLQSDIHAADQYAFCPVRKSTL